MFLAAQAHTMQHIPDARKIIGYAKVIVDHLGHLLEDSEFVGDPEGYNYARYVGLHLERVIVSCDTFATTEGSIPHLTSLDSFCHLTGIHK